MVSLIKNELRLVVYMRADNKDMMKLNGKKYNKYIKEYIPEKMDEIFKNFFIKFYLEAYNILLPNNRSEKVKYYQI